MNYNLFTVKLIFIIVNFVCLYIMWKYSNRLAKSNNEKVCRQSALMVILAYSFNMGLRFGRDIDYNIYFDRYNGIGEHFANYDYEIGFKCICWFLYNIGIPYWGFILLCSVFIISALMYVVRNHYKEYAPFICLIFLWEAHDVELLIRYYLAFGFFIFAFSFFKQGKFLKTCLFVLFACNVHIGMLPICLAVISLMKFDRLLAPPIIIELLMVFTVFSGETKMLSFWDPYLQLLSIGEKATYYTEGFSDLINGDFGKVGTLSTFNFTTAVRRLLQYSLPIFIAPVLVNKNILNTLECNLYYIGVIIAPIFVQVEILNRISATFTFFSVFVISTSLVYIFNNRHSYKKPILYLAYLTLFASVWPVFSGILFRTEWWHMLYIWDAGNMDTIPLQYFWSEIN